jgi:hypothetical protein
VKIPHISSGKTTQFFYGYQYTLIHSGSAAGTFTAPTAAEEGLTSSSTADATPITATSATSGTFNGSGPLQSGRPASRSITRSRRGIPNNHIPSSAFDPAAVAFEKYFPTATADSAAGKIGNLVNYFSATQNYFNEHTARVDHQFGANDHLFGRYFYDWYQQPAIYNTATSIATRRTSKPATRMRCSLKPTPSRPTC